MTTTAAPGSFDANAATAPAPVDEPRRNGGRRVWIVLGAIAVVAVAAVGIYLAATHGKESTDDAQVQADVVQLAPRVAGAVLRVLVQDNAHVHAGDPILQIDDADYGVRVKQAEADLAAADAAVAHAEPQAVQSDLDLARARRLKARGTIPQQDLERADVTARTSRSTLAQARANQAAARAALSLANLQFGYTKVVAPEDGTVSDLTARAGEILAADQPFAQFVPDRAYVVANFKETQTGRMRPGQRASISIDAYSHRSFAGRVESLSAGTGAQFSLLPANNATGNFVKVVQRVPVRIAFDGLPQGIALRAGLSANVTVDVR
jgi:membrane fusion protein (multidrug efflux system)